MLAGESLVLGLLGKALFEPPQREWLQSLIQNNVFDDIPFGIENKDVSKGLTFLQKWSAENSGDLLNQNFDDLQTDYARLFIGPAKVLAPPWESVYFSEERLVFQEQTLQVREWYRRFGLQAVKLYAEPDDHLGLELIFLAHLAQRGLTALEKNDRLELQTLLEAQWGFLGSHPGKWVPIWCEQVAQQATTDFYRGIAYMIKGTLSELSMWLLQTHTVSHPMEV
jgi:TorA maturation chaperone TorD